MQTAYNTHNATCDITECNLLDDMQLRLEPQKALYCFFFPTRAVELPKNL